KLRLAPGERLLDIGCGWGSLVIWAAERYGVEAYGVTLSAEQAEWAGSAIRRAGLEGRARVEHLDYRDLPARLRFENIAAVGLLGVVHAGLDRPLPDRGRSARPGGCDRASHRARGDLRARGTTGPRPGLLRGR